jgi:hypothetical protein
MGQYRKGTATFTNGDATVTFAGGTTLLTSAAAGDLIKPDGTRVWAEIASITSDTEVELAAVWNGDSVSGSTYVIHTDFTANLALPYPVPGDVETQDVFRKAMLILDAALSGGGDPILLPAGTVSLPSLAWSADPDCGPYRIGANNIGWSIGGAKLWDWASASATLTGALTTSGKALVQGQLQVSGAFTADVANSMVFAMNTSEGRIIVEGPNTGTKGTYSLIMATSNASAIVTAHSADASGYNYFTHPTTGSAANAVIDSSTGLLQRSTSSMRYKVDAEPLVDSSKVLQLESIWYRSNPELCPNDNPSWSWYSFSAEQAASIDPRFVHWTREVTGMRDEIEEVQVPVTEEVELPAIEVIDGQAVLVKKLQRRPVIDRLPVVDESGSPVMVDAVDPSGRSVRVQATHAVPRTETITRTRQVPIYGDLIPDAVQDRPIVAMLVEEVKKLRAELDALKFQ